MITDKYFLLTFLLVGFSYGATLTHCTRLHFTNYRITDVTSALMREDMVRLWMISNMFKIIVKQFWKASNSNIHFLQNNDDNIYLRAEKANFLQRFAKAQCQAFWHEKCPCQAVSKKFQYMKNLIPFRFVVQWLGRKTWKNNGKL